MQERILIADDDKHTRELMKAFLANEGFSVRSFSNGYDLLAQVEKETPCLVILDVMMPGMDGLNTCAALRQRAPELPIIIVSAKDSPYDRVTGLTIGSDDYMTKPFLPLELVARVRALLRRSSRSINPQEGRETLSFGSLSLLPKQRIAYLDDRELALTPTEFDFLAYLILHGKTAVSRKELLNSLWDLDEQADTRAADDLVKRLRRKLRANNSPVAIQTIWGYGFRLVLEEQE